MSLRSTIVSDMQEIESDLGNPTFTWKANDYIFVPSISEFQRDLDNGGYQIVKLLTATVRKYNIDSNDIFQSIFPNGTPSPQDIINYSLDGTKYRIESIKHDPTNSYFRIIAHSTTKGI